MHVTSASSEHWADATAARVLAAGGAPVISTGISPSGEVHIGNMREILTGDAIFRALADRGVAARFNYVADNFDPLRRVYPFLDARDYAEHVGRPLSEIPCPCTRHASYAEHFLEPFLAALQALGVRVEVERADQLYKSGRMVPYVLQALQARERIAAILAELTGKEADADWWPFTPLCPACRRMNGARVVGFSRPQESVEYRCRCGAGGSLPLAGGGKLVWRVDWPARWKLLGVTVEPFGKDHATRGGSYDTGVRIVQEVFGGQPPLPVTYEWIRLKGRGDMSSSRGIAPSIAGMLEVAPPEALRYLVMRERPQKAIDFDPGLGLLQLIDELDDDAAGSRDERALALSRAAGFPPVGVPFKHLVVVAQAAGFDAGKTAAILRRTGYPGVGAEALQRRLGYARRWLESFAPEDLRFVVQPRLPAEAAALAPAQRRFLGRLAERLSPELDGPAIHALVYELAGECADAPAAELFRAIYLVLLGKPRGPRAGWFIAVLGTEFCRARFGEASGAVA
jgi:lysyl-tRNA synthetase class 1